MPIYDFRCPECGDELELLAMADFDGYWCVKCDAKMERLITAHARTPELWLK